MTMPGRWLEPLTQPVRARLGKHILLDTTHAQLLFEGDERHPWRAMPYDALLAPLAGSPGQTADRSPDRHTRTGGTVSQAADPPRLPRTRSGVRERRQNALASRPWPNSRARAGGGTATTGHWAWATQ